MYNELTITEILNDPMIRLMMRADRMSVKAMRYLLEDAARKQEIERFKRQHAA